MKYWFTSDTHFGSDRTLELSRRPYKNVEEMNWDMVKKWNSIVGFNDTVYHLGDFGEYGFRNHLNGNIVLLLGNYERSDIADSLVSINSLNTRYKFDTVLDSLNHYVSINQTILKLVHEPSHSKLEESDDTFYLFGHIHKAQLIKENGLNVGVDVHDFKPVDIETILFYKKAIENHYDEEVFMR